MRLSGQFIYLFIYLFFYEEMQIKYKVIYIHFMPPHAFFKDLRTNIKNKALQERLFTCRLSV